jgi:hypothetical protein
VYDSGHRGATSNFSMSTPIGANISIAAPRPTGNWELEMATGFPGGSITGYLSLADWYRETHQVARVSQSADEITLKLLEWSRYDICEAVENGCTNAPGRFVAHGWLSEVDSPGEWYYDRVNNILYIFPPAETSVLATSKKLSSLRLGAWSAGAWIRLLNASWVTVRDLTIQGAAQKGAPAVVSIEGGSNNAVGGCTIRNSALTAVSVNGGLRHTVIGNDIYDVARHISSVGPIESIRSMIPSNHLFANNHITQLYMRGFYGGVHITNVGDRFSGNLVHDCMGQVITMQGPLTMLDSNEIFNTGYVRQFDWCHATGSCQILTVCSSVSQAEGDGGVMYNAGSLTRGYGMSFHNNFIHHSLCVPGLHPRGGIYFDGHQQGCTNLSHNVMYKAAGRAFIVNGGPNYQVNNNLVINGGTGVYQQNADFTKVPPKGWSGSYLSWYLEAKDNSTHTPSPWDFIWNSEQDLGVHVANMSSTMLATRFPSFAQAITVNSTEKGWASVEHSAFQHNMYLNLSGCKVAFLTRGVNGTPPVATGQLGEQHDYGTVVCDQAIDKNGFAHWIDRRDSIDAMWSWFPHSRQLEFKHPLINVDTGRAGLRCDQWRKSMPSPAAYRPWVRAAFAHLNSSGGPTYSREIATEISGLRSGKHLLLGLTKPCPSPSSSSVDCEGVLLPWGQCEANGTQIMRWTVEQFGVGAGKPCEYRDGTELRVSCRAKP